MHIAVGVHANHAGAFERRDGGVNQSSGHVVRRSLPQMPWHGCFQPSYDGNDMRHATPDQLKGVFGLFRVSNTVSAGTKAGARNNQTS